MLAVGKDTEANVAALKHWAAVSGGCSIHTMNIKIPAPCYLRYSCTAWKQVSSGLEAKRASFQAWVSFARLEHIGRLGRAHEALMQKVTEMAMEGAVASLHGQMA